MTKEGKDAVTSSPTSTLSLGSSKKTNSFRIDKKYRTSAIQLTLTNANLYVIILLESMKTWGQTELDRSSYSRISSLLFLLQVELLSELGFLGKFW